MEKLGPGDPQRIGGYRLLGRLGEGGMGQVFLARSDRGRTVAVKLVRPELAAREEFRARFRHEVRNAQRVGGFWTAPVLDADTEAAVPWVATGYVAGPSLQQVVGHDHGPLPERSVRILAAGLAHALTNIHAAGIVHRDLKPSNVMVTIEGPRVIDFGVARALETVTGDGGLTYLGDGGLTQTGAVIGSPGFMAPEQVRGDRITPACDIFCLGSVLAYAATGVLPFGSAEQQGAHALLFRIAEEEPDLTRVPEGLADLVRACLRKDPAARPTLEWILERTGAEDTVADGRSRDPWLPGTLVAQLGRHAVRLLETEDPEGAVPEVAPQHSGPPDHVPTLAAPHPAYGYPQQYPAAPPQRPTPVPAAAPVPVPHNPYAADAMAYDPYDPYDPEPAPRRSGRSTVLLLAVAAVVALGAGGAVYAFMNGDGNVSGANPDPTRSASAPPSESGGESSSPPPSPSSSPSPSQQGSIPGDYLGTWTTTINTADTRRLTLTQGEVGDTVLRLVADGEAYHCEFAATLTEAPTPEAPLTLGPSEVTTGEPLSSCSPGAATEVTLLPDGRLQRLNPTTGEKLTYSRS
ncbi:serine/threonine protein kinase [Streptomyces phaeoluteigriseus]|uniref:Serine/threonine protein kinase n=1 Tax=Streptomyces phaeoluteigriseus TaxID=114686 RepID=A0A1V6ML42_9ACTN|nr:serine/threonine-protein kinase [Streptomyces phaeoluteigriseus]OQD53003.1 serine/threonine protein kinase [Streptomyces phaeoluteigriseus]